MNAEFVHAADQFFAIANNELDHTVNVVKRVLDGGADPAATSIDLKMSMTKWSHENLETVLTAALLRLAREEGRLTTG